MEIWFRANYGIKYLPIVSEDFDAILNPFD